VPGRLRAYLLLLPIACASVVAAGGCTKSKASADAAAGGSVGGGGGSGGNTGAAGSQGTIDGGADAPVAMTAEQVCRDAIIAQCERIATCAGVSSDGCAVLAEHCPGYYFSPTSLRTIENVSACIPKIRAASCTDIMLGNYNSCLAGGTGGGGAPCVAASQCQSGSCSGYWPTCGTCTPALAVGDPCGSGAAICPVGTRCNATTHVCAAVMPVAHA
jgi:hypothetical protein